MCEKPKKTDALSDVTKLDLPRRRRCVETIGVKEVRMVFALQGIRVFMYVGIANLFN